MTVQTSSLSRKIDKEEKHSFQSMLLFWFQKTVLFCTLFLLSGVTTSCTTQKMIINGLDEREANEIVVFLSSKGIDAYKIQAKAEGPGGGGGPVLFDIAVDSKISTEAMSILNANGLPRRRPQKLLDLFGAGGLVPSEMQEKIRFQSGLAEQIAGTIRKIDGILDADIQLSFPEEDPLNPQNKKGVVTASVFIKHQGVLDDPNSQLIPKIRRLVASSVQGLSYDNVTVISDKGRFSDLLQSKMKGTLKGNSELVRIWTVAVAKESVSRFQIIFTSCAVLLFIITGFALWFFWKLLPVAKSCGGVQTIFSLSPLSLHYGENEIEPTGETVEDEEEKKPSPITKSKKSSKKAQENIEES